MINTHLFYLQVKKKVMKYMKSLLVIVNLFYTYHIININSFLMKLFQGITNKEVKIDIIQINQGEFVQLTTSDLICFGLMMDSRLKYKIQTMQLYRKQGQNKKCYVQIQLETQQETVRQILDQYEIIVVEDHQSNLVLFNQNQYDRLPIVCSYKIEKSKCQYITQNLLQSEIDFIKIRQKLFVNRQGEQSLRFLLDQVCQLNEILFSVDFISPDIYLNQILNCLSYNKIIYQIRSQILQDQSQVINFFISIVHRNQGKFQLKNSNLKEYLCQKMIGIALILAKFQQLDLDFEFAFYQDIQNHNITLLSQIVVQNLNQSVAAVIKIPVLGQKIIDWADQDYEVILDSFVKKIRKTDFTNIAYFFSTNVSHYTKFEQDLIFISQNWNIYGFKLQEKMNQVQDLIDFKIFAMENYEVIYPNVYRILKMLQLSTNYVGSRSNVKKQVTDDITDTLYINFFKQLQARTLRNAPYYLKDQTNGNKLLLADVIASKIQYDTQTIQNNYWQDIFNRIRLLVKKIGAASKKADQKINNDQIANCEFMNNIEKQRLLDLGCLSCCPIFYTDYNIYDQLVNKTPIEIVQKITRLTDLQNDLKDKICYFLNNQGGVILFDVTRKYREYIPLGQIFTKKDQQAYSQKIEAIIQTITPKPNIRENIEISFVPLVKNAMLNPIKQKIQVKKTETSFQTVYYSRPYIQGMFVARIKVKPTNPWKTYYWTSGDKVNVPERVNSLKIKAMQGRKIHKYMADKFKQYYIPENLSSQQRQIKQLLMPRISCFHPGKCIDPDEGMPSYQIKIQKETDQKPQTKYKYMSLLIARRGDHQTIKQRLRRKGIDCEIVLLYSDRSFKAANNSAAIYHDVRFDYLLSEISYNRDFQFAGRYAMVIFISQFLKLPDYKRATQMTQKSFLALQVWMKRYNLNQSIKFWSYDNGEIEQFYLQTESQMSTVLMYYVMSQFGQRCIFKNPKNFDRLTQSQKESRIKVYFPKPKIPKAMPSPYQSNQAQVQKIYYLDKFDKDDSEFFWHDDIINDQQKEYRFDLQKKLNKQDNT